MIRYFFSASAISFFCCLFTCCSLYAQTEISVVDLSTHQPLPYASVVNFTKKSLDFTNEKGMATVNFQPGDSIKISYVGYKEKTWLLEKNLQKVFTLEQDAALLKPVKLIPCTHWETTTYSNIDSAEKYPAFGGVEFGMHAQNGRVAFMIKPSTENARLDKIIIWLLRHPGGTKQSVKAPLKLSFLAIADSSLLPGESLTSKQIIYYPQKEGKQIIHADSIHLYLPPNGFYLCFEYIIDKKYEFPVKILNPDDGSVTEQIFYGAVLDGVRCRDFVPAFFNYQKNEWLFYGRKVLPEPEKVHGTIKCALELSNCNEKKQ